MFVLMHAWVLSHVWLFATHWTVALQAPLSMGFSWQKYWRGLLFPPLGDFPDPELKPVSFVSPTLQADSLPLSHKGSPFFLIGMLKIICILKVKVKVKSLSLSDPQRPHGLSLPGSSIHGIFQAIVLEWVAISFSNAWKWKVKVKSLNRVRPSATPWTAAFQALLSMGFSRQEYWSGVPLPSLNWYIGWLSKCYGIYDGQRGANRVSQRVSSFVTKQNPMGTFWDRPLPYILCFSSSLKCVDSSIWCTFPELFYGC